MSLGTQVAVILGSIIVVTAAMIALGVVAINAKRPTRIRMLAGAGIVALVIAGLIGIAMSVDASCRDPNQRPCVGVDKEYP